MVGTSVFAELSESAAGVTGIYDSDVTVSTTHSISVPQNDSSSATTILDFNHLGHSGTYGGQRWPTISEEGYTLTTPGWAGFSNFGSSHTSYPGSPALFIDTPNSEAMLTKTNGDLFDLISIDLTNIFYDDTTFSSVGFVGTMADGSTVQKTCEDSSTNGVGSGELTFDTTCAFTDFTDMTSVTFGLQTYPYHQFDNIVLETGRSTAVPEPTTVASMVIGGLILGGSVLRKKK